MIFVVLGTQDKPFDRLLKVIDQAVKDGVITDKIVVQAGETDFHSDNMEIRKIIPMNEFNQLIKDSDLVICHAGYGILSSALEAGKKVLSAARLAEYGEHQNNHQCDILDYYEKKSYIMALHDFSKFNETFKSLKDFEPKKYNVSFEKLTDFICDFIDNNGKINIMRVGGGTTV